MLMVEAWWSYWWLQDHQCSYAHSREEQLGEHNLNASPHHKHKNQQLVREQKSAQEQFQYMPPGFLGVSAEVLRDLHSGPDKSDNCPPNSSNSSQIQWWISFKSNI